MVGEFLHIHSVENGLILKRAENDSGLGFITGFKGDRALDLGALRLEKHAEYVQALIGRIRGTEVQRDNVLMNPREAAVGIQQVLVRRAAADESHAAGRRRAEAKAALKIRVRLILDRPGSIDHDQMGKPVRHALDDGRVLIGIVTSALQIVGDRIALRGILLHKGLAFRRIRLDSGDHFRAAGFIEIKAVVVDADVVQITKLLPG